MPRELSKIAVEFKDNGFERLKSMGIDLTEEIKKDLNIVAKNVLFAYQSKVPIRTGELRNTQLQVNFARSLDSVASVYVVDRVHVNSWGTPPTASGLADTLNIGTFKRSRVSDARAPFGTASSPDTTGWIAEGDAAVIDYSEGASF